MKISHRLRQVGRLAFKRESSLYKLGASAYHRLRPVLVRLSLDERTALNNAMQLAAIARASTTCRPRAGGKRIESVVAADVGQAIFLAGVEGAVVVLVEINLEVREPRSLVVLGVAV